MTDPIDRDENWVFEKFGDVGSQPSDEVVIDTNAEPAPNIERPCGDGVNDG